MQRKVQFASWILGLLFWATPALSDSFSDLSYKPYLKSVYEDIVSEYDSRGCRSYICSYADFLKSLEKYTHRDISPLRDTWQSLFLLPAENRVRVFLMAMYSELGTLFEAEKGSLEESLLILLALEIILDDLNLKPDHPHYDELVAELQERAFRAFQFERAWQLGFSKRKKDYSSISDVRRGLVKTRILTFVDRNRPALEELTLISRAEALQSPDVVISPVHQSQRRWLWTQMYQSAGYLSLAFHQKLMNLFWGTHIVPVPDPKEAQLESVKKALADAQTGNREKADRIGQGMLMADAFNRVIWEYFRSEKEAGLMNTAGRKIGVAEEELSRKWGMPVRFIELRSY